MKAVAMSSTSPPPSYSEVMASSSPQVNQDVSQQGIRPPKGLDRFSPPGPVPSAGSGTGTHPNFPKPAGGKQATAGGGSFWAQQASSGQVSQSVGQPQVAARGEAPAEARQPISPRSQTASPRAPERVSPPHSPPHFPAISKSSVWQSPLAPRLHICASECPCPPKSSIAGEEPCDWSLHSAYLCLAQSSST